MITAYPAARNTDNEFTAVGAHHDGRAEAKPMQILQVDRYPEDVN
jgi:hypothetical protein